MYNMYKVSYILDLEVIRETKETKSAPESMSSVDTECYEVFRAWQIQRQLQKQLPLRLVWRSSLRSRDHACPYGMVVQLFRRSLRPPRVLQPPLLQGLHVCKAGQLFHISVQREHLRQPQLHGRAFDKVDLSFRKSPQGRACKADLSCHRLSQLRLQPLGYACMVVQPCRRLPLLHVPQV